LFTVVSDDRGVINTLG